MEKKHALHCPNCGASVTHDCVCCPYCRSTLSVTACPNCFASVFAGMKYCPDCGVALNRAVISEKKDQLCPKCTLPLKQIVIGQVPLCECGTCGGIWLDTETFESLLEKTSDQERILAYDRYQTTESGNQTKQSPWRYMPCPECSELMLRKNFLGCSGVIIDYCKNHGTWFEHRELQQIVKFIQSGGMQVARKKELDRLKVEQEKRKDIKVNQAISHMLLAENIIKTETPEKSPVIDIPEPFYKLIKKLLGK